MLNNYICLVLCAKGLGEKVLSAKVLSTKLLGNNTNTNWFVPNPNVLQEDATYSSNSNY